MVVVKRTKPSHEFFRYAFVFRLLSSGLATADFPSSFGPIFCILLRHFNHCHAVSHRIHKLPFKPSPFHLSSFLHTKPPQPCLSCFLFKGISYVLAASIGWLSVVESIEPMLCISMSKRRLKHFTSWPQKRILRLSVDRASFVSLEGKYVSDVWLLGQFSLLCE